MNILQKEDLAAASFANTNANAAGGVAIRTDAGSTVGAAISAAIAANTIEEATAAEIQAASPKVVVASQLIQALEQGLSAFAMRIGGLVTGLFGINRQNLSLELEYGSGAVYRLVQFFTATSGGTPTPAQFVVGLSSEAFPIAVSIGGKDKFGQVNDGPGVNDGTIYWYYTAGNYVEAMGIVTVPPGSAGKTVAIPAMPNVLLATATIQNSAGNSTGVIPVSANRLSSNAIQITHADPANQQVSWRATGKF